MRFMNKKIAIFGAFCASFAFVNPSYAEYKPGTSGYGQFVNMQPPSIDNNNLQTNSTMVCYSTFCSYSSGLLRIPVYSAENLTAQQVKDAKGASRKSLSFFPDPHIPAEFSSRVSDFTNTGYDRGHMAPWADSADPDCFTLANILPQMADNNRHLWEGIETSVRKLALSYGQVYVISGPIFSQQVTFMNGRVAIPDHLYKAVYVPALHKTSVYIVKNADGYEWTQTNLDNLYQLTHVRQFPGLASSETDMFQLPEPDVHGKHIPMMNGNIFDTSVVTNASSGEGNQLKDTAKSYVRHESHNILKRFLKSW